MKVSVILPIYNAEGYLADCLDSLLAQTLDEVELVCVDDGSTDASPEILKEYAAKHPNIKIIRQQNAGAGAARNHGLQEAFGKYVIFCDPDDGYPADNVLEVLYEGAEENGVLAAGGSFSIIDEEAGDVQTEFDGLLDGYTFDEPGVIYYKDYQFDYGFMRFLFDRDFLLSQGIRFPEYKRYQDPPFMVRALNAAEKFYATPEIVYAYNLGHQGDFWTTEKRLALLDGIADVLEYARSNGLEKLYALEVARIEHEYEGLFSNYIEDDATFAKLIKLSDSIDWDLLPEPIREEDAAGEGLYLLRPLRGLLEELRRVRAVEAGKSYDLARKLSKINKVVRGKK